MRSRARCRVRERERERARERERERENERKETRRQGVDAGLGTFLGIVPHLLPTSRALREPNTRSRDDLHHSPHNLPIGLEDYDAETAHVVPVPVVEVHER